MVARVNWYRTLCLLVVPVWPDWSYCRSSPATDVLGWAVSKFRLPKVIRRLVIISTERRLAILQMSDSPSGSIKADPENTGAWSFCKWINTPIASLSQDSTRRHKRQRRAAREQHRGGGVGSFLEGLMRRRVRDQSTPDPVTGNENPKVTIDGHPAPDNVVELARSFREITGGFSLCFGLRKLNSCLFLWKRFPDK